MVKIKAGEIDTNGWDQPWSDDQRARYETVLANSSDRLLRKRRAASASALGGAMPEGQAREFYGKHYDNVMAEVTMRREVMGMAKLMDEGKVPATPEAVEALRGRQADFFADSAPRIVPPEDLDFDALKK